MPVNCFCDEPIGILSGAPGDLIYIKTRATPDAITARYAFKNNKCPRFAGYAARRSAMEIPPEVVPAENRSRETHVFVFLTVVLAPMLAVAVVGSYGLLIWLYQTFMGPPKG